MPSIHARTLPRTPYISLAASNPRKNVATVAAIVVAKEMSSGEASIGSVTVPLL